MCFVVPWFKTNTLTSGRNIFDVTTRNDELWIFKIYKHSTACSPLPLAFYQSLLLQHRFIRFIEIPCVSATSCMCLNLLNMCLSLFPWSITSRAKIINSTVLVFLIEIKILSQYKQFMLQKIYIVCKIRTFYASE